MNLVKTINLDFGNDALAAWEQECQKINAANANNAVVVYEEIDGWEAREIFDAKWSEDGKERISDHVNVIKNSFDARILGLAFSALPTESSLRIKNFLVEKKVVKVPQKVEVQELPNKPVVKVLNKMAAYAIIKTEQPMLKIQHYDLNDYYWENGKKVCPKLFYTTPYSVLIKIETFWRDLDEDGKIFVVRKYYKQKIYRVYANRFEVWETQAEVKETTEYTFNVYTKRFEVWETQDYDGSVGEVGIGSWSDKGYF